MSASPRSCATLRRPTGSATPQYTWPGCFCGWKPTCAPRLSGGRSSHCSTPIGAIALVDEHAHDGDRHRHALLRRDCDAEVRGEIAVSGDAAYRDTKAYRAIRAPRAEADVVGV